MEKSEDESSSSSLHSDTSSDQSAWDKPYLGEPFMRVLATDKDTGKNADIEYSIKAGRGKGRFNIHPEKGVIYSHKMFSAGQEFDLVVRGVLPSMVREEQLNVLARKVKATDHGFPNKSSTARIAIHVVAVPDAKTPPFIKLKQQKVEVTEADPVGFLVALIQATDENDYLWFKIV
ncbi:hypothetical protein J6590_096232, partial [Homalodisca vitripennis]